MAILDFYNHAHSSLNFVETIPFHYKGMGSDINLFLTCIFYLLDNIKKSVLDWMLGKPTRLPSRVVARSYPPRNKRAGLSKGVQAPPFQALEVNKPVLSIHRVHPAVISLRAPKGTSLVVEQPPKGSFKKLKNKFADQLRLAKDLHLKKSIKKT